MPENEEENIFREADRALIAQSTLFRVSQVTTIPLIPMWRHLLVCGLKNNCRFVSPDVVANTHFHDARLHSSHDCYVHKTNYPQLKGGFSIGQIAHSFDLTGGALIFPSSSGYWMIASYECEDTLG